MSTVKVLQTVFLGTSRGQITLHAGDEYEADDPMVQAYPSLFTQPPPEPKRRQVRRG